CATFRRSDACIAFDNLYYWIQVDAGAKPVVPYAYAAAIVVPLLSSSQRGTNALAAFVVASSVVVGSVYRAGFVSVWCFVMAIASGMIAVILRLAPLRPFSAPDASGGSRRSG